MTPLRVVFFGTPDFAIPSLTALLDAGFEVPLAVTQPDRPVGRHAQARPSPIAALAAARGVPTAKPNTIRGNADLLARVGQIRPDAIAVVAYGRLLPREILELARLGCVNVHASLLPRHRGASPIQSAILAGDRETGVATMRMEEGLDTGPIYLERRVTIGERETAGELSKRLATLGGQLLVETLEGLGAGDLSPRPQQGEASVSRPIRREDARIDWTRGAEELSRRLRAYTPWPGLYTFLDGERIKILEAEVGEAGSRASPGTVGLAEGRLFATAGGGSTLRLERLQRAGRKPVTGAEFARAVALPARFDPPSPGGRGSG
jgi:methionyl-tRNA formyltransferase